MRTTPKTRDTDRARKSYKHARERYLADNERWTKEENSYYSHSTGSLLPTQHADLSGFALDLADARGGKSVLVKDFSIVLIFIRKRFLTHRCRRQFPIRPS